MKLSTHRLLAAALTIGAFSFTPNAFAKEPKKEDRPQAAESEVQVKYASLSKVVKESLDKERGDREIKSIYRVERDGRVFYRATIDFKGADHQVRIAEDGGVLGEAATADTSKPEAPARNTGIVPPRARPASEEGAVVDYNKLPGPVKMGIAGQAKANRIKEVRRVGSGRNEVYKAEVGNDVRNWLITVDASGKVLSETEDTDNSKIVAGFDSLPGPVKTGVIREARGAKVGKVMQISRAKETYYRIELLTNPEPRWITVNDDGKAVDYPTK